ncbi:hypothetical protein ACFSHQ_12210 [Gemmobacter lanyuensis]
MVDLTITAREARDRIFALRRTQDFAQVQAGIVKKHASRAPARTAPASPQRQRAGAAEPGSLTPIYPEILQVFSLDAEE